VLNRIINDGRSTIYLWKITEHVNDLGDLLMPYKSLALDGIEENLSNKLWHHTHFLSTRILMFKYAGLKTPVFKNEFGKPVHSSVHISITHSNEYAAIIVSDRNEVAIDLEKIDQRILRVGHKFINEKEMFFKEGESVMFTTLIWSAKETLYKLYSENRVIFKDELLIHPFEFSSPGKFRGDIIKAPRLFNAEIRYILLDQYILTWCSQ